MDATSTKIWGISEGPQPGWPCERGLNLVGQKHEWQNDVSLTTQGGTPNNGNIKNWVAPGKILADLGCGTGQFASELKQAMPNIHIIAAGVHNVDPEFVGSMNALFYGKIPTQTEMLKEYTGQCQAVVETYGPTTYDHPTKSMAYALHLLEAHGTYSCVSSTVNKDIPHSVFGSAQHFHSVIKPFFERRFKVIVSFVETRIQSDVTPGLRMTDFITRMRSPGHNFVGIEDFEETCRLLDKEVGIPRIRNITWVEDGKNFSIRQVVWPKDPVIEKGEDFETLPRFDIDLK